MGKTRASCRDWLPVVLVALALASGCKTSLDPVDEEIGLFSIHGVLTLSQEPHYVRVRNLKDPVFDGSDAGVNATVTLEHLDSGTVETLTDSIAVFDGVQTHNFRSEQDIQPDATYRLVVEKPDGRSTEATATTPPQTQVDVEPTGPTKCVQSVGLHYKNVPDRRLLRIDVGIPWRNQWKWVDLDVPTTGPEGTPVVSFDAATIIDRIIPERIQATVGYNPKKFCNLLDDNKLRVAYTHFGPDWPADSVRTDPVASTVKNGLGVFGGLHRDTLQKAIDLPE